MTQDPFIFPDANEVEQRLLTGADALPDPLREPLVSFASNDWYGQRRALNRYRRRFPGLLRGAAHRGMAADQLGYEFKRSREDLRALIYGWLPEEAFA